MVLGRARSGEAAVKRRTFSRDRYRKRQKRFQDEARADVLAGRPFIHYPTWCTWVREGEYRRFPLTTRTFFVQPGRDTINLAPWDSRIVVDSYRGEGRVVRLYEFVGQAWWPVGAPLETHNVD